MPPHQPTRVALFNPIIAHYRAGLLRALRASERCAYSLFADRADTVDGIPALDLATDPLFVRTKCTRIGRFTWQHGVLNAIRQDFDVYILVGNAEWLSSWVIAVLARLRGKRVLFWTHGWTRHDGSIKRLTRNAMYRIAHGMLLYGERACKIGIQYGFDPARLYVMYNSLDFETQQIVAAGISQDDRIALRARLFGETETPVVIGVARLTTAKRFDLLIRALSRLARRGKRVNLLLVGDGSQRAELSALAIELEVHAVLVGACYDEQELARMFACANVTVSPGNIGLTCMHSLGYGVPVITHDNPNSQGPEWEAITPAATGTLFKEDCIDSLAAAIDEWTKIMWVDPKTRDRCVESIRARYHPVRQHQIIEMAVLGTPASIVDGSPATIRG